MSSARMMWLVARSKAAAERCMILNACTRNDRRLYERFGTVERDQGHAGGSRLHVCREGWIP